MRIGGADTIFPILGDAPSMRGISVSEVQLCRPRFPCLIRKNCFAHSSWVHALAVSLVHDVSMADDVVQDTWVAALKRPPRTKKVRSWLAAVVMNSVRQRHRARNRREKREKLFAPSEHLASTEEIVEIESERRRVVDAVLLLHEPYRSTVLLRYWSDLSADEIAHREGVPSSTIRNRLRRALLRVRAELDRGGREKTARALQALVIFAPAGTLTGKASLSGAASLPVIGALMMNAKLIVAAAFVILSVLGWQVLVADGSRPGIEADTRARPVIASTERTSHRTTRAMPTRESLEFKSTLPVSEPSRVDALPDANDPMTAGRSLFGSVMDESGRPVVGAQVRLRINSADEESTRVKASGEYWLTGLPSGEGDLLASAIGFQTVRVSVDLAAGGTRADLVLRPEIEIGVKFLTDEGEPLFETMKEEKTTSSLLRNALFVIATETEPPKTIGETCPSDRFGCGVYRAERPRNPEQPDGFVVCDREPPLFLSAVLGNVVLRTKEVVADTDKVEFWISPADIEALGSTIQFRVVEKATNRPMQKHVAVAVASTAMVCIGKEPDAHGTYVLDGGGLRAGRVMGSGAGVSTVLPILASGAGRDRRSRRDRS